MEAILNLIKSNEEEILNLYKKIELLKEQNEKLNKKIRRDVKSRLIIFYITLTRSFIKSLYVFLTRCMLCIP